MRDGGKWSGKNAQKKKLKEEANNGWKVVERTQVFWTKRKEKIETEDRQVGA